MQALKDIREIRGNVPVVSFDQRRLTDQQNLWWMEIPMLSGGEPEYTMLELVKALEAKSNIKGIKSVSFRAKSELYPTKKILLGK